MAKKILVIYFTQSGQLLEAVQATLKNITATNEVQLTYEALQPATPFPFPWSYMQFWDAFPETVQGVPCELKPVSIPENEKFDLVLLAYQPWFLSVSRPMDSFLQLERAKSLLKETPVITLIACRNMWLNAQEKMKSRLRALHANHVGNITYVDRSPNLVSLVTVLAFTLGGVTGKFLNLFPKYGVSRKELDEEAWKYGDIILKYVRSGNFVGLQDELAGMGAVKIKSNLIIMEGRGKKLFPLYASFITRKGGPGSRARRLRVRTFGIVLPILILVLSPIITLTSRLVPLLSPGRFERQKGYYSSTRLVD